MKNCTKHFLERWTERIKGIKNEKDRNSYINGNREMIIEHANKTFEHAEFIYRGQIGDNITRNYYIEDDIIFVTNTSDDAFITVYKVDLGFPPNLNATVRRELLEEIKKLTEEKEKVEYQILEEVEDKKFQLSLLDDNIKILEEQLKNYKKAKEIGELEIKNIESKSLNTGLELRRYTMMLVNSKEYKSDLTSMK